MRLLPKWLYRSHSSGGRILEAASHKSYGSCRGYVGGSAVNHYEEKQAAKAERMLKRAAKLRSEGQSSINRAQRLADFIPMGQPILVGHHSERRHRRDLDRINKGYEKGWAAVQYAAKLEERAANVGKNGVSSDDPDAIAKLEAQIADLEAWQEMAKATNKLVRKNDREGLAAMGHSPERIEQLLTPDRWQGFLGFASYSITNNNANIRRLKQRIEQIKALQLTPLIDVKGEGWHLYEDADANRLYIDFDETPTEEVRSDLKSHGFRWTPSLGVWGRQRSNAATYHAKRILGVA